MILFAACYHTDKFTLIDIGAYRNENDGEIFSRSSFDLEKDKP